jgi:hypothetical protein
LEIVGSLLEPVISRLVVLLYKWFTAIEQLGKVLDQGRRKMIKVRGAERLARTAARGAPGAWPAGKFLIFNSLKHVFLHLGVRFGIELGRRKIQSSSASYISAPCVLNVSVQLCIHFEIHLEIRISREAQPSASKS